MPHSTPSSNTGPGSARWKIGQIIKKTGLTARALHFYEKQRLIGPVDRSASGHRLYSRIDLLRLQQIRSMRLLGMSLEDIRSVLVDDPHLLPNQLQAQLERLREQRRTIAQLEDRITQLLEVIEGNNLGDERLGELLIESLADTAVYERIFSRTEIEESHRREINGAAIEVIWPEWLSRLASVASSGEPPDSDAAQAVVDDWYEIMLAATGHDEEKFDAMFKLFRESPAARADHGLDDRLFAYLTAAIAHSNRL